MIDSDPDEICGGADGGGGIDDDGGDNEGASGLNAWVPVAPDMGRSCSN